MTLTVFAQIAGAVIGLAIFAFGLVMARDMGTEFARFEGIFQRREARKERRAERAS